MRNNLETQNTILLHSNKIISGRLLVGFCVSFFRRSARLNAIVVLPQRIANVLAVNYEKMEVSKRLNNVLGVCVQAKWERYKNTNILEK